MIRNGMNSQHTFAYRPDIDGLRSFAVISVILFHAFPKLLPSGFIGVDIFFVISGFLISSILLNDLEQSSFSIVKFYSRRILRIFPALLLILIFCLVLGWFLLLSDEYQQLGKHTVFGISFLSNFSLWL
jgi:peptidoglycan/LPS O-acetylase OafA/YrhL